MVETAGVAARFFQGALELPGGGFVFSQAFVNDTQMIVRHHVLGSQRQGQFEMLMGLFQLAAVEQSKRETVMGRVVVGIDFQAATEFLRSARHVATMVVGNTQVVVSENERRRCSDRFLVAARGLVQQTFVKVKSAEQMISKNVAGLHREQTFQFMARFLASAFTLVDKRQQEPLVNRGVS